MRPIHLNFGGWGTRGKCGTERLKAAMFHGLGYEATVKTTGCEAMLIHSVPDQPPHEIASRATQRALGSASTARSCSRSSSRCVRT